MADGLTHERYWELGWWVSTPISFLTALIIALGFDPAFAGLFLLFFPVNYQLAKYITPDSDMMVMTIGEWGILADAKSKLGWLGGLLATIWNAWWLIYAYIAGKHRSFYSHSLPVGTLGRMVHLNIIPVYNLLSGYSWSLLSIPGFVVKAILAYLASQFLQWTIADGIHLILDSEWAKGRLYYQAKTGYMNKTPAVRQDNNVLRRRKNK